MFIAMGMAVCNRRALIFDVGRYEIELPVANTPLSLDRIGETTDISGRTTQDNAFYAMLMIQMRMHGGNGQIVVVMLEPDQAFCQITLVMIVDVAEVGDAMPGLFIRLAQQFKLPPQQVTNCFRPVAITSHPNQPIELSRQFSVERYGETFHSNDLL